MSALKPNYTYLPCTLEQWTSLLIEITDSINEIVTPNKLNSDYVSQVLMHAIHAYDHKIGVVSKEELVESCINRISCQVTFNVVEDLSKRLRAEAEKNNQDPRLTIVDEDEESL